jgi:hypothetical protein
MHGNYVKSGCIGHARISLSRSRARETVEVRGRASAQGSKSYLPQGKIDRLLPLTMDPAESPRCIIGDPTPGAQNSIKREFCSVLSRPAKTPLKCPSLNLICSIDETRRRVLTQAEKYYPGKEPRRRTCSVKPRGGGLSPPSVQSVCLVRNVPFWALRKGRMQRYERKFKAHPNVIA